MTGGQVFQTGFEILLAVTLLVAFVNRDKLAAWEQKVLYNIKRKRNIKRKK